MFPKLRSKTVLLFMFLVSMTAIAGTNPFLASADTVVSCPSDGSQLATFTLCGSNDTRSFQVNDPDVQSIQWQSLDASSCGSSEQDCPNLNGSCIWNTVATGVSLTLNGAGEYRVVFNYGNGTNDIFYAKVIQATYSDVINQTQMISVHGGSDGELELSVSGDSGPYIHQLYRNGTLITPFQSSPIFTGLSTGMYQIRTQDASGVCEYDSAIIELTEPEVLVAQLMLIQTPSCIEGGTIEVNASGGVLPYQYALNGGTFIASNIFTDLTPGTYSVQVIDANGVTLTNSIVVLDNPPITVTYSTQDVTCFGSQDGLILVEAVGGNGNYEYQLNSNGVQGLYQNSNVFEGLAPGSYDIAVRDSGGCISNSSPIIISEAPPLVLEYTTTSTSDATTADGIIALTATGGTGPYQYSIDGGMTFSSSNILENLVAGQYAVLAADASGCFVNIGIIELTSSSPLAVTAAVQNQISCNSGASVLLTPSGGVPPYEFSSNGSSYRTTNPFITGSEGSTTFTVRDATGATATSNAVMITAAPESISVNVGSGYDCNGVDLPRVDFQLIRGSGNMQYSIYDGIWQSSTTFLDVPDGDYLAKAKNDSCQVEIPITVANVAPVKVRVLEQNDEGWVKFQILSGTGPYNYRIDAYSSPRVSIGSETIFEIDGFSPGPHWLVVEGDNCSDHVSFDIEGFIPELEIVTEINNTSCFGAMDASINVTGVGGLGEYNYGLVDGDNNIIYNVRPEISHFQGLAPGTYKALLRDVTLGKLVRSELITITEPSQLNVTLQSITGTQPNLNNGVASLEVIGGTLPYEYSLDGDNLYSPIVASKISELSAGDHIANIRDANGCETVITFTIAVETLTEPSIVVEVEHVNCGENEVTLFASGGSGNYLFALDTTDPSDAQGLNVFNTIAAGNHYAAVFDANGYVKTAEFTIENNVPIVITTSMSYNEDNTSASANLVVEGGQAPYAFSNDGVTYQTAAIFVDLSEGDQTFYVKDALGCTVEDTVTIEYATDKKDIDEEQKVDVVIYQNTGRTEIIDVLWDVIQKSETTISVYNGKGTLVYTSEIEEGTGQTQIYVSNLSRGIYFIHIKNEEMEEVKKILIL